MAVDVRKGQGDVKLTREEFERRLRERFYDPAFQAVKRQIADVVNVAWRVYDEYHKSPRTRKAGPGFADPEFELPIEWLETRERIQQAEREQKDAGRPGRVLLVCSSARHDQTCPGEMSKAPSVLKLMMDRLVCADGGNPDQTTTRGKSAKKAKALELTGWSYPRHLAGRVFAVVVHGDVVGAETLRRSLSDWLTDMKLVPALRQGGLDRYIGYYEPYATSHDALDRDTAVQDEVRPTARALIEAVGLMRARRLPQFDAETDPRPK